MLQYIKRTFKILKRKFLLDFLSKSFQSFFHFCQKRTDSVALFGHDFWFTGTLWQKRFKRSGAITAAVVMILLCGLIFSVQHFRAGTLTKTWTAKADWETGTTRNQLDTATSAGNVTLAENPELQITFNSKFGLGLSDGQFNNPSGVAVDSSGNIYVADKSNNRIQVFQNDGTFIRKFGSYGSGDGQFNNPSGVAVDSSGNIYVAETGNHRIQVFQNDGTLLGWLGKGTATTGWHNPGSGETGVSGTGDGQFKYPYGVALDSSGNIYVADTNNYRIQVFQNDGTLLGWLGKGTSTTGWHNPGSGETGTYGSGDGQFYFPDGVALDSSGNIYVADTNNHRIQVFQNDGTFIRKFGTSGSGDGQFNNPSGIAVDSSGNIYVADEYNHRIQVFQNDGTFIRKFGTKSWSGDGQFNNPSGVALDSSGNIYVADTGNHRIQVFQNDGTLLGWLGKGTATTGWHNPGSGETGVSGTGDGQFYNPRGVALDSSDKIYVADSSNHRIQVFQNDGTFIRKFGSYGTGDGQFSSPYGVAVDSSGKIYVDDTYNNRIQVFQNDGTFIRKFGSYGTGDGQFKYPYGVALDSSGNIYVADTNNYRIQVFQNDGTLLGWLGKGTSTTGWHNPGSGETGVSGSGDGQFNNPSGVAVDSSGNIYVADTNNHRIQVFQNDGTLLGWLGKDDLGNSGWHDPGSGRIAGYSGSGDGQFNNPRGVAVDSSGKIYVADTYNYCIQIFNNADNYYFSGTVYTAEDKSTNIGIGKTVALSINGATATTVETTSGGAFEFNSVAVTANDIVAVYVADETEKASLITQVASGTTNLTGLELFTSHVVLTHQTAGPMTNTLLATADNVSDPDLLVSVDGSSNATFTTGIKVWILGGKTYTPGGNVTATELDLRSTSTFSPESNTLTLTGSGTPFVVSGTFENSTSTIKYTGTGATNITATTYYNLELKPVGSSPTYTFTSGTINVEGNYVNGDGTNAVTTTATTNDPTLNIDGNFSNSANATFIASDSGNFSVAGNFTNSTTGTFTHSSGTLTLDGSSNQTITSGGDSFYNLTITNASSSPGVTFADALDVDNLLKDITPSSTLTFTAGTTSTINDIELDGQAEGTRIVIRSTTDSQANWTVASTPQTDVSYVSVSYNNALPGEDIDASNGTNYDGGNNDGWIFNIAPVNNSLTFTNPYSSNIAIADDTTEWNFRALVTDANGPTDINYVELRFANSVDNSQPYDSLKFRWTESTDTFSEEADTQNAATITSTNSDSSSGDNQWTLDFKIKFNNNFLSKDTNYAIELYSIDDSFESDNDNYYDKYQVNALSISIVLDDDTIELGNLLPGSVIMATSVVIVTTNHPNGYGLSVHDGVSGTDSCLLHTDMTTRIVDYSGTIMAPTLWSGTGLGICLYSATGKNTDQWGMGTTESDSNNKYAGVPETATVIHEKTGSSTVGDTNSIGYKLVVPNSQKTGNYSGMLTYTATGRLN